MPSERLREPLKSVSRVERRQRIHRCGTLCGFKSLLSYYLPSTKRAWLLPTLNRDHDDKFPASQLRGPGSTPGKSSATHDQDRAVFGRPYIVSSSFFCPREGIPAPFGVGSGRDEQPSVEPGLRRDDS